MRSRERIRGTRSLRSFAAFNPVVFSEGPSHDIKSVGVHGEQRKSAPRSVMFGRQVPGLGWYYPISEVCSSGSDQSPQSGRRHLAHGEPAGGKHTPANGPPAPEGRHTAQRLPDVAPPWLNARA